MSPKFLWVKAVTNGHHSSPVNFKVNEIPRIRDMRLSYTDLGEVEIERGQTLDINTA
jgi:hypothetical protein